MPEPINLPEQDPEIAAEFRRVRTLGAALVARLHGVFRAMRVYDTGNRALRAQQQELLDAVRALHADDVSVLGMGEYFYVNGVRLRAEGSQLTVFRAVLAEFEERRLGGLRFLAPLQLDELESFLRAFHSDRSETAMATLEEDASRTTTRNVWVVRARRPGVHAAAEGGSTTGNHDHHRTRLVFQRAMTGTRELMLRTARTHRPAMQQARRVVQSLVDHLLSNKGSLVEFTALKRHDEYTYAHCVNVSILSIRMGQVLGFSRTELAGVGVAGLLHDTGKIAVPVEVLGKPGQLAPHEWTLLRRHPVEGLRIVSRLPGISELMLDAMRVAFEHHMNVDHSGYPAVTGAREMGAFSRIVAVADCFDAVTSHRAYRSRPMTGYEALRLLLGQEAGRFDRAALWALVKTVGLFPAGTLLRTESGRLLLSITPNPDDPRRPACRELIAGPTGATVASTDDVILGELERVARVLAPEDVGVDVEALLAA
jgi:HD-GYP domain-containing protein (c-di-GMP phosphodiesterase class II)